MREHNFSEACVSLNLAHIFLDCFRSSPLPPLPILLCILVHLLSRQPLEKVPQPTWTEPKESPS